GIYAINNGTGSLTVISTGTAAGTRTRGISARNGGTGVDLSITAADTSGGEYGIHARNYGTGALAITSTGAAASTLGDGIN
ncbi:hypothetical protein ACSTJP_00295, partial [Vibrio parahaemolyticus]